MAASWSSRIRRWFRRKPPTSGSFDPHAFEQLCREDPEAAREALRRDHRELAEELAQTSAAYQERLEAFSARLDSLTPRALEQELSVLRSAQDAIRRMLRRMDASEREAGELEEELREWESRADEPGVRHADHPDVRAEIIRSELAARGRMPRLAAIPPEASPFRNLECVELEREDAPAPAVSSQEPLPEEEVSFPDANHLLHTIRHLTRDAERWHGSPTVDREIVEDLTHLRSLHAVLKRLDRAQGIQRDRISFAVRMR